MLRNCLCALAGAWSLQCCAHLPPDWLLVAALPVAAGALALRRLRPLGFFLVGLCLVWSSSRSVIEDRLSPALSGQTQRVVGRIADFPNAGTDPLRLILETGHSPELPQRIRLSWYDAPVAPRIGETWQLEVRLRRPRGFSNPLRFDYEYWLFRQRIGATGYVVNGPDNLRRRDIPVDRLSALRQRLVDRMIAVLGHGDATAVLMAITAGATHEIDRDAWDRYAASGTSHIMAISGMNIAMAAGGAYLLAWLLLAPFCRAANVRDGAAVAAALTAIAYAEISGFAIPARRAMLMTLLVMVAGLLRRQLDTRRLLAVSCLIVVTAAPLAVHAPGFKLSFAAVAILLWLARQQSFPGVAFDVPLPRARRRLVPGATNDGAQRLLRYPPLRQAAFATTRLAALQITLLLGLLPLTALLFGRVAWLAPLVNLLVLPVFDLVIVPAGLLGLLLDGPFRFAGDGLLVVAWYGVRLLLWLIDIVAAWPAAQMHIANLDGAIRIVAFLPAIRALLPPGFPGRKLALVAALATVLHKPPAPPPGCLDLTALDVGQGLSLVLHTRRRTLVYDTGPAFRSGSDTGDLVLVPYLRAEGIKRVDALVVSHADLDHAGGVGSLLDGVPVAWIFAGERLPAVEARSRRYRHCRRGQAWLWDGVRFAFMHPGDGAAAEGNNASCVLQLAVGPHTVLLTGDIEAPVEEQLLKADVLKPADLVVIPHHGSRTSSTAGFVRALLPPHAIVSAGFDNRWGLPKADVVQRWEGAGAAVLNTATAGAITFRICPRTGSRLTLRNRVDNRRYWHDD